MSDQEPRKPLVNWGETLKTFLTNQPVVPQRTEEEWNAPVPPDELARMGPFLFVEDTSGRISPEDFAAFAQNINEMAGDPNPMIVYDYTTEPLPVKPVMLSDGEQLIQMDFPDSDPYTSDSQ